MSNLVPGTRIHTRTYDIDAVVVDESHFRLDGRVNDIKPDGMWGVADDTPMDMHDMHVSITIALDGLVITAVDVAMVTHPHDECPGILATYQQLVGLSIARGFTNKVRELFGGPRACTHIGALINAMAPVAMQSVWAFANATGQSVSADDPVIRERAISRNLNTCHVWAEDGPMVEAFRSGSHHRLPIPARKRLAERGIDPETWRG